MENRHVRRPRRFWPAAVLAAAAVVAVAAVSLFSGRVWVRLADLPQTAPGPVPAAGGELPQGDGFVCVAENDGLRLEWDGEEALFRIVSKADGTVWQSGYDLDRLENYSRRERRLMTALAQIGYLDETGTETSLSSGAAGVTVTAEALEGGLRLTLDMGEAQIALALELWLTDGGFTVRIPPDSVVESGACRLLTVDVLPAFGAHMEGEDAFFVYPDGCGALIDLTEAGRTAGVYTKSVYADAYADLGARQDAFADGETGVPLPYLGSAARGKQGYIAYIENGAESARVTFSVGGGTLPLDRLYATAVCRQSRTVTNGQDVSAVLFADKAAMPDLRIGYRLLDAGETTYSAMACALRTHMQSLGVLPDTLRTAEPQAMLIEWLIGARQNELLRTGGLLMTGFGDVDRCLTALEQAGVPSTRSLLLGWQREGYGVYPQSAVPMRAAGGRRGLSALLATANETRRLYPETDLVQANGHGQLSVRRDAVTDFMRSAVTDESGQLYLLSPLRQYDRFTRRDLGRLTGFGAKGLAFSSLGQFLPADYSAGRQVGAADTARVYAALLSAAHGAGAEVLTQTGAAYLLPGSDMLYDVYDHTSGLTVYSREIPFMQMLLHGLIAYAGTTPGNMSADHTQTVLQWAEQGSVPYYLLSAESSARMENAVQADVFNTRFSDWQQTVAKTAADLADRLSPVAGRVMLTHERTGDLARVTYEGGYTLLVNYAGVPAETAEGTVPAQDFLLCRKGGEG